MVRDSQDTSFKAISVGNNGIKLKEQIGAACLLHLLASLELDNYTFNFGSNLWFNNSQLLQELGGLMAIKDQAEVNNHAIKLSRE